MGPNDPLWNTRTSLRRIISNNARNVVMSPLRDDTSANSSSNPQASVSDNLAISCWMRVSIGTCSAGSGMAGRCFARSTTARKADNKTEQIDFELRLVLLAGDLRDAVVRSAPLGTSHRFPIVQQLSCRLEFLMLQQAAHERLAGILFGLILRGIRPRQQHTGLDVDERRRHQQEVAGHIEIQLLHQLQVLEVLLGYQHDGNVVNVDFVLPDEVQEQVERPLEAAHLDRVVREDRFEVGRSFHEMWSLVVGRES